MLYLGFFVDQESSYHLVCILIQNISAICTCIFHFLLERAHSYFLNDEVYVFSSNSSFFRFCSSGAKQYDGCCLCILLAPIPNALSELPRNLVSARSGKRPGPETKLG
jgi:hypothetical protein